MKQFSFLVLQFVLLFVQIESHTFYKTCTKTDDLDVEELSKLDFKISDDETFSKQEFEIEKFDNDVSKFNILSETWMYADESGNLGNSWERWDIDNDLYFLDCPNGFTGSDSVTGDLDSLCYIKISSEERPYLELEVVYQKKNSDDQCYDNFEDYEINGSHENSTNSPEEPDNKEENTNNETPKEPDNESDDEDENINEEIDNENQNTNEESSNEDENTNEDEESDNKSDNEDEDTNEDEESDNKSDNEDEDTNEDEESDNESDNEEKPKTKYHPWQCGEGIRKCKHGYCCSKYGWCGKSGAYCSKKRGCQSDYGFCW
jgi:hypothetical protein